eukprot:1855403-Prymnesium_polylepis.1
MMMIGDLGERGAAQCRELETRGHTPSGDGSLFVDAHAVRLSPLCAAATAHATADHRDGAARAPVHSDSTDCGCLSLGDTGIDTPPGPSPRRLWHLCQAERGM